MLFSEHHTVEKEKTLLFHIFLPDYFKLLVLVLYFFSKCEVFLCDI